MLDQEEYLISYANLKSGLFKYQKNFLDKKSLEKFYHRTYYGIPQCLPAGIKYFNYSKAYYFKINKKYFSKKIFKTSNLNYIGNKKFFRYGTLFANNVTLKKKYKKKFNFYINNIYLSRKKIQNLHKKYNKICSMQIRNAPHYGHEAVFKYILSKFDLLILNPIFGIKKKNDFTDKFITKALKFVEKKYKKIKFIPFWTNFYYGGPREAMHHLAMREKLGFKNFYIGRDHAGAENLYNPLASSNTVKKYVNKFKIKSLTSRGGYYCYNCENYVIKGLCKHKGLLNISGTEFRNYLKKNKIYLHADPNLQKILN
tara:strand:+ start:2492 stop:3430 length:939 start_codon:yes stop_codon:yes gene_type:complete